MAEYIKLPFTDDIREIQNWRKEVSDYINNFSFAEINTKIDNIYINIDGGSAVSTYGGIPESLDGGSANSTYGGIPVSIDCGGA